MPIENDINDNAMTTPRDEAAEVGAAPQTPQPEGGYKSSGKRIAKNSMALYFRMFLTMIVGIYTSRVVLNVLGVDDYGVYNVVGAVVLMMGFITASMSGATSRFLTYELGRNDKQRLAETFSSALIIHIGIALLIFVLCETIGLWFLINKLVIPEGRMTAAHVVFQLSVFGTMLGVTQVPYTAVLIAHEKMGSYAYFEIISVTLKLLIVFLLQLWDYDKLILYSILVLAVNVLMIVIYRVYCLRHFEESHFRRLWKPEILKPMLSFSGWDLFGNASNLARTQGVSMLANMFFGTVANAAIGIAFTVQNMVMQFAANVSQAVRPQVVKTYSVGDTDQMSKLIYTSAKYLYLLLLMVSVPIFMETYYVLELWLKMVPRYSVWFVRILIFFNLFSQMSIVMAMGIHATGKIKRISLINGTLYLLVLPFTYICYRMHGSIYVAFTFNVVAVFIGCLCNVYTLGLTVKQITLKQFIRRVLLPVTPITVVAFLAAYSPRLFMQPGFWRLVVVTLISTVVTLGMTYAIAEPEAKEWIKSKLKKLLRH